ncbi:vitamin K epoxide reductase family protein (plasmid) [Pseudalkalibacillus hwajinpoensis]|uniref:vitamin K epoxide reductase family protein n=1 Tax=Guptibacillus hwajinpoensis TaxID=208199 RepID=UPI00325B8F26
MMLKRSVSVFLLQTISIIGLLVSIYLLLAHLSSSFFCPIGDCVKVNDSQYASLAGIPLPILGLIFYTTLFISTFLIRFSHLIIIPKIVLISGLLFSIYLTYLEVFIIQAVCFWCVISFLLVITATFIVFSKQPKQA